MSGNGFDQWGGYMEAKITKLEEQFSASSDPYRQSTLFAGISIYVNGLTNPSADQLKRIMMVHGGTYHHYERSHTTYIIASNLPDVKVRNMNTSKIISPQWVVDCVKEMRILDYTRYLLYTNHKVSQPRIIFKKGKDTPEIVNKLNATEKSRDKDIKEVDGKCGDVEKTITKEVTRTAVDPKFLAEFYNNSRLHHIATLGAGFKQYIADLREQHGSNEFPARTKLKEYLHASCSHTGRTSSETWVMHIDMDCFFVSVGLRKYPQLKGLPVAVTHSKGGANAKEVPIHPDVDRKTEMELFAKRFDQHLHNNILSDKVRGGFEAKMSLSEIASCSYEARAKGIRNGMFVGQALQLCHELKTIPYDFEGYREVAYTLYDTIAQYTLNIEAVSCDEMFVDLTEVLEDIQVDPMDFVHAVREEVRQKTACPCSAGVGGNKLQARMATKRAKPDGQYLLLPNVAQEYMTDIKIEELPGVGSSTSYTLKQHNLVTCGDLQKISLVKLQMHVGKKLGETLFNFCRGIDNRPLTYGQIRKSVSAEVNYGIRFKEFSELETFLRQICTEVHTRLSNINRRTKCITLKLMVRSKDAPLEAAKFMGHGVCDNITKSVSLSDYTSDVGVITRTVLTTVKALEVPPNELRGIGIQLSKLNDPSEGKKHKKNIILNMFNKVVDKQKDSNHKISDISIVNDIPDVPESCIAAHTKLKREQPGKTNGKRIRGKVSGGCTDKKYKNTPDVLDLMQKVATKRSISAVGSNHIPKGIDPEVFAALPSDIRAEILKAHQHALHDSGTNEINSLRHLSDRSNSSSLNDSDFHPSTSKAAKLKQECRKLRKLQEQQDNIKLTEIAPSTAIQLDSEFLSALPQSLRMEIEREFVQPPIKSDISCYLNAYDKRQKERIALQKCSNTSPDNIFMHANCKELLLAWLKSADVPEMYDIELIGSHAIELVAAEEIDRLYTPLMYLCKVLNRQKRDGTPNDCLWHAAYHRIIEGVQKEMEQAYDGRHLFVGEKLKCDNCVKNI